MDGRRGGSLTFLCIDTRREKKERDRGIEREKKGREGRGRGGREGERKPR